MTPFVKRRILLVEDESLMRSLLRGVLVDAGFDVLDCASAEEAARQFGEFDPDLLVCDIDLGGGISGLSLVASLTASAPYLAAVILSNYAITPEYLRGGLAGVTYLRKSEVDDPGVLLQAIEATLRDAGTSPAGDTSGQPLARLTASQVQILRMIAEGLSNAEIAARRGSSLRAVEKLVHRTFAALGLSEDPTRNTRVAAARIYYEQAGRPPGTTAETEAPDGAH